MPPPPLTDELIEEIFLRLPSDEPACLVRASLASKLWRGILTGPDFGRRNRELDARRKYELYLWLMKTAQDCILMVLAPTSSTEHHLHQAPSRSTLTNIAAQPVSHKRGNAAAHDHVSTVLKEKDERIREEEEAAKRVADWRVKVDAARKEAQREGKPIWLNLLKGRGPLGSTRKMTNLEATRIL